MKLLALCDTIYTNFSVSVETLSEMNVEIIPNPVRDLLQIHLSQSIPACVTITDLQGKEIRTLETLGKTKLQVQVNDLAPGTYFVKIATGHNIVTRKFVKI